MRAEFLVEASKKLKRTKLFTSDFYETLINFDEGDLVFIDPPYVVVDGNNGFVEYDEKIFSWDDQLRLKRFLTNIDKRGAYFIMTNAKHKTIKNLYSIFKKPITIKRYNKIGGINAKRGEIS